MSGPRCWCILFCAGFYRFFGLFFLPYLLTSMSVEVFFAVSLGPAYTTFFDSFFGTALPSLKVTWHLKIDGWETNFLLGWPIFRCYVCFKEFICLKTNTTWRSWLSKNVPHLGVFQPNPPQHLCLFPLGCLELSQNPQNHQDKWWIPSLNFGNLQGSYMTEIVRCASKGGFQKSSTSLEFARTVFSIPIWSDSTNCMHIN